MVPQRPLGYRERTCPILDVQLAATLGDSVASETVGRILSFSLFFHSLSRFLAFILYLSYIPSHIFFVSPLVFHVAQLQRERIYGTEIVENVKKNIADETCRKKLGKRLGFA